MKYNNDWILKQERKEEHLEFIFFWGHQPSKNGNIGKSCFSQWYISPFEYEGLNYPTAEHWMMAGKAKVFKDQESLELILNSNDPKEAKHLGRKVKNFNHQVWEEHKLNIVKNGNFLKFTQNPDLWEFLNQTENKIIVEASPYDRIWGIGMKSTDIGINNPKNWKGENLLGYALMEVRDIIRENDKRRI